MLFTRHSFHIMLTLLAGLVVLFLSCGERGTTYPSGAYYDQYYTSESGWNPYYNNREGENYAEIVDNPFVSAYENPLSTFSIDVDTASYTIIRSYVMDSETLPPSNAVRIEEMLNYFTYTYDEPEGNAPFTVTGEVATCPWQTEHKLVQLKIKGKEVALEDGPAANLVFLLDVSGSMNDEKKLPLLQSSFDVFVANLRTNDRVSIVTYASEERIVLSGALGSERTRISNAIHSLTADGSTAGERGIQQAYQVAADYFVEGGNNRVILATDGDFNVGISDEEELKTFIETKRDTGVFLTVLGFGTGNYQDAKMETLADSGNGNYYYVDSLREGERVLGCELTGTLFAIAKDVKIQVAFNTNLVYAYRLIGYENRVLSTEDFTNDSVDAGELGAGHTVTAFYQVVPRGVTNVSVANISTRTNAEMTNVPASYGISEMVEVKLRYKEPESNVSTEYAERVAITDRAYTNATEDFLFAASVATFGMILRTSPYKGSATYASVLDLAERGNKSGTNEFRNEFLDLVTAAERIAQNGASGQ